jgi:hypothetical protein
MQRPVEGLRNVEKAERALEWWRVLVCLGDLGSAVFDVVDVGRGGRVCSK